MAHLNGSHGLQSLAPAKKYYLAQVSQAPVELQVAHFESHNLQSPLFK